MDWNIRVERVGLTRQLSTLQNKTIMIYDANAFRTTTRYLFPVFPLVVDSPQVDAAHVKRSFAQHFAARDFHRLG